MLYSVERNDLELLIETYIKKQLELQEQLKEVERNLWRLRQMQKSNGRNGKVISSPVVSRAGELSYNAHGTWVEKIKFVMLSKNEPVNTGEIVETILQMEPDRIPDKGRIRTCISATLSVGVTNGKYIRKGKFGEVYEYSLAK